MSEERKPDDDLGAGDALQWAMVTTGTEKATAAEKCEELFGTRQWSQLTVSQRWALVAAIDPEAMGPYGENMAAFA